MGLPFNESFGALAGVLATPPWTQANLVATTLNTDGSGHGKASGTSATDILAYNNSNTFTNDQSAQVTINAGLASLTNYASVVLRGSGSGASFAGYEIYTDGQTGSTHTELAKFASGSPTVLTNFAATFAAGDVLKATIVGNVITVYKNGVSVGTFTDGGAAPPAGAPGCGVTNTGANNVLLTNFQGDNVPATVSGGFYGSARLGPQIGPRDRRGFLPQMAWAYPSLVAAAIAVNPGQGALQIDGFAPTVAVSNNQSVTPGLGSLTLTGFAPTLVVDSVVNPGKGDLVLTGFAPTVATPVAVVPGMGAFILTGFAPTVATPVAVSPGKGDLTLTGFAPSAVVDSQVKPGVGQLVITGFAPTVATPIAVLPGKGDLALTGFAPSVAVGTNINPGSGALSLDGFAPTVVATANQNIAADVGQITITGFAPTVDVSGGVTPPTVPDVRIGAGSGEGGGLGLFAAMRAAESQRGVDSRPIDSLVAPVEPLPLVVVPPVVPRRVVAVEPAQVHTLESVEHRAPIELGPSLIPELELVAVVETEPFTDAALDTLRARTQAAHDLAAAERAASEQAKVDSVAALERAARDRQAAIAHTKAEMFAPRASIEPKRPTSPVAHAALLAETQRQVLADEELAWVLLIAS